MSTTRFTPRDPSRTAFIYDAVPLPRTPDTPDGWMQEALILSAKFTDAALKAKSVGEALWLSERMQVIMEVYGDAGLLALKRAGEL